MNEFDMRFLVEEALNSHNDENDIGISNIVSFKEALLLTSGEGLIVKLMDGSEFQLTIVKSKSAD